MERERVIVKTRLLLFAQAIKSTIDSVIVPYFNVNKIMLWVNMAETEYDVEQ